MSNIDNAAMSSESCTIPDGVFHWGESGLSKREYAAIHLKVPDSGDSDLDKMIMQSLSIEDKRSKGEVYTSDYGHIKYQKWLKDSYKNLNEAVKK